RPTAYVGVEMVSAEALPVYKTATQVAGPCAIGDNQVSLPAALQFLALSLTDLKQSCQTSSCALDLRDRVVSGALATAGHAAELSPLITADELLEQIAAGMTAHSDYAALNGDMSGIGNAVIQLESEACAVSRYQLSANFVPGTNVTLAQEPITYQLHLINEGSQTTTADVTLTPPTGAAISWTTHTATMAPTEELSIPVVITPTQLGTFIINADINAAESTAVHYETNGILTSVDSLLEIVNVAPVPAFVETGSGTMPVVMAEIANVANIPLSGDAVVQLLDGNGNEIYVSTPQPVAFDSALIPLSYEAGSIDSSGLLTGAYSIIVSVLDEHGDLIPNASGQGVLSVGQLLTASSQVEPAIVAPGDAEVTTTIDVTVNEGLLGWVSAIIERALALLQEANPAPEEDQSSHAPPALLDRPRRLSKPASRPALAAATYFTVTVPITQTAAGVPFDLTVTAADGDGNLDTSYTGTMAFTSSDPNATLPGMSNLVLNLPVVQISASSQYNSSYAPTHAVDGNAGSDWATAGQTSNAWIRLDFDSPTLIDRAVLRDRANLTDFITTSHLEFSDGSTVDVGSLPNNGDPQDIFFSERTVEWIRYHIDTGGGQNVGLAEFELYSPQYTYTFTSTDSGQHTFSGIVLGIVGTQTITVTDTADGSVQGVVTVDVLPGIADATHSQVTVTGPHLADGVDEATVTVSVADEFDNPISGAEVWLTPSGTENQITPYPAVTDAQGQTVITLTTTQPKAKAISFVINDHNQASVRVSTPHFIEFTGAVITGTVFSDPNRDNVQQAGESGLGGVQLSLYRDDDPDFLKQTVTEDDGSYSFTSLVPGTYRVVQPQLGSYAFTLPGDTTIEITGLETVADVNFGSYDAAHVIGAVWNDGNQDGLRQEDEPGIANATISAYDDQNMLAGTTTSDANGDYQLDLAADLPVAPSNFTFSADRYWIQEPATAVAANFDFSSSQTPIDSTYYPLNYDFTNAQITQPTSTLPLNFDFTNDRITLPETTYPTNYDFSTNDLAGWTPSDITYVSVLSDSNGYTDSGAYVHISQEGHYIDSSPFTLSSDTQSMRFNYRNLYRGGGYNGTLDVYVLTGSEFTTVTNVGTYVRTWDQGWGTGVVDLQDYQGQTIKVRFQPQNNGSY
ncbi:MAG: hypothetical protein GY803_06385, partial [Chloroflexi bacterium]|nr:hypothetical protein [Chloroflexota bacterium]